MSQETERQISMTEHLLQGIMRDLEHAERRGFNTIIVTGAARMKLVRALTMLGGLRIVRDTYEFGRPVLWIQRGTKEKPP